MTTTLANHQSRQNGFTLLEVLIALSLFSLTIYAVYSSTFTTTQSTRTTRLYQRAVNLAENMQQYLLSHHNNPSDYQIKWQAQIAASLPAGSGFLTITPSNSTIKITWGGMTTEQCQEPQTGIKGCIITTRNTSNEYKA